MISGSKLMLSGAAALAMAAAAMPALAAAKPATTIYGGGSSLIAPYIRQAGDCYGQNLPLLFKGTPPTEQNAPAFDYTGRPPQDCSMASQDHSKTNAIDYISTGSGTGIKAFFSHDPTQYGTVDPNGSTTYFPTVNYGLSDTSLGAAEVAIYNNGGTDSTVGVTVVAPGGTPGTGQYPNPAQNYGAMIQFPMLVAPVAIVFDPVYKKVRASDGSLKEYAFNIANARDGGGLHLDTNTVCAIFNGYVTNWNDAALKKLNGRQSLEDPSDTGRFSVPMQIVGRQDSSGTTSIFSRYISNVCASYTGNSYVNSHSRLPGTYVDMSGATQTTETANKDLTNVVWNKASADNSAPAGEQLGLFTLADGNDGVTRYVDFSLEPSSTIGDAMVQGRIGYAGPDYALPYVNNTGANTYNLFTADVQNASGKFIAPTPAGAADAYANILPPESDGAGNYLPNSSCGTQSESGRCRENPQDWVEAADKSSVLANPSGRASYPIVGTTNFLGYTCYATSTTEGVVSDFFNYYLTSKTISDKTLGLLASSGFSPVPNSFVTAIQKTFLKGGILNLNISYTGSGQAQCKGTTGA